jgi:SecD/SecF fusion protein
MFTAIFCSRIIFDVAERKRWLSKLGMTRILEKTKFDFLSKIGFTGVMSALLIGAGLVGMFFLGSKILDHDLRGGSTVRMVFNETQELDDIRQTLKDRGLKVKGELIEFFVAKFKGPEQNAADDGKMFRVDSNLPAWEGGNEEDRWIQLDELMTELFPGKLKHYKVDVTGGAGAGVDLGSTQSLPAWNSSPTYAFHSGPLQEDEGSSISPAPEGGEAPAETQEPAGDAEPQESTDETESQEPEVSDEDKPVLPGGDLPVDEGLTLRQPGLTFNTETTVTIDPPILGKSLRSEIVESARKLEMELEDEQVVLVSNDILEGENADGTVSPNWTIKLNVPQEEDGAAIIKEWSEDLNAQPYFPTSSKVGSQIAGSMRVNAALAIIFSLIGIIAYIWARFQNIAFGLAAVVALVHDVLVVLGMIALSHYLFGLFGGTRILGIENFKISLEIIAALLTVIGYSLNDTIVVFDRIREVRGKRKQITSDMINTSISQTLSRTILTSVTTFVVVFILYCFGGDAIHGFAFALVVGVIVGTYSSIFIASPALLWLMNTVGLSPEPVESDTVAGQV